MHDVGCRCTLNGVTFSYLQQKYEPWCTLNGVTFTYLQQKYKALILDNVVRASSIVSNGLLQHPQPKGDPWSETYGEHFGSKAGVLLTELPSLIFVRFKPSMPFKPSPPQFQTFLAAKSSDQFRLPCVPIPNVQVYC